MNALPLAVLVHVHDDQSAYADADDLAGQATGWIEGALDDRDGITGVEVGSGASVVAEAYRHAAALVDDTAEEYGNDNAREALAEAAGRVRQYADALDEADARIPAEYVDPDDEDQDDEPDTYRVDDRGLPKYHRADVDGDRLLIAVGEIPGQGAALYFRTDRNGSGVPVDELPELIVRLQQIADAARYDVESRAADEAEETAK
ncbi:hypothetical protein [Streptomyces sp. NPDC026673]|uniref:hypothetical protein n=1 Tax=Streptomyces sp. NPDC026673 TaxID=3155724 RepID=UPI00340D3A64